MGRLLYSLATSGAPSTRATSFDTGIISHFSNSTSSAARSRSTSPITVRNHLPVLNQQPFTRETAEAMDEFTSGRRHALEEDHPFDGRAAHPPGGVPMVREINRTFLGRSPSIEDWIPLPQHAMYRGRHILDVLHERGQAQYRETDCEDDIGLI